MVPSQHGSRWFQVPLSCCKHMRAVSYRSARCISVAGVYELCSYGLWQQLERRRGARVRLDIGCLRRVARHALWRDFGKSKGAPRGPAQRVSAQGLSARIT